MSDIKTTLEEAVFQQQQNDDVHTLRNHVVAAKSANVANPEHLISLLSNIIQQPGVNASVLRDAIAATRNIEGVNPEHLISFYTNVAENPNANSHVLRDIFEAIREENIGTDTQRLEFYINAIQQPGTNASVLRDAIADVKRDVQEVNLGRLGLFYTNAAEHPSVEPGVWQDILNAIREQNIGTNPIFSRISANIHIRSEERFNNVIGAGQELDVATRQRPYHYVIIRH